MIDATLGTGSSCHGLSAVRDITRHGVSPLGDDDLICRRLQIYSRGFGNISSHLYSVLVTSLRANLLAPSTTAVGLKSSRTNVQVES